jgi:hypothetical protein
VWFIADGVNTALFSALLASFAAEIGAGLDKHVILVLDGSGLHVAKDLEVPEGVELIFLSPYSTQIQPAERMWPLTNEPIVNEYFDTLEELDEVLIERCYILADDPDQIRAPPFSIDGHSIIRDKPKLVQNTDWKNHSCGKPVNGTQSFWRKRHSPNAHLHFVQCGPQMNVCFKQVR